MEFKISKFEGCVAQATTKFKLGTKRRVPKTCFFGLEKFVIIGDVAIWSLRISEGKLAAGIVVTEKNIRDCGASFVAGVVGHEYGLSAICSTANYARATLTQHQHNRLARGFQRVG